MILDSLFNKILKVPVIGKIFHLVLKRVFPKWISKYIAKSLGKLYNQVDHFLAYGDTVPYYQPTDNIYGSPPTGAEVSEEEYRKLFTTEQVQAIERSITGRMTRRVVPAFGPPNPPILGYPSSTLPSPLTSGAEVSREEYIEMLKNMGKPANEVFIAGPGTTPDEHFCEEPKPSDMLFEQYVEYLKGEISAGLGISKEELFSELPDKDFFSQALDLLKRKEEMEIELRQKEIADAIREVKIQGLETWQAEYMQNPGREPSPAARDYLATIEHAARALRDNVFPLVRAVMSEGGNYTGEVVWSGTIGGPRRNRVKITFNDFILLKADLCDHRRKVNRVCFTDGCERTLGFAGFIEANIPKDFKGYHRLKRLWYYKYEGKNKINMKIELYCCDCHTARNSRRIEL
ncbi:MAG TPA: hypothetical protein ENI23_15200 [bacterium]|nr:hypothetical protein [bacterium]